MKQLMWLRIIHSGLETDVYTWRYAVCTPSTWCIREMNEQIQPTQQSSCFVAKTSVVQCIILLIIIQLLHKWKIAQYIPTFDMKVPHKVHNALTLIEQCLMSPQHRLSGRQFYKSKDPTNSIKVLKEKNSTKVNPEKANNTKYSRTIKIHTYKNT